MDIGAAGDAEAGWESAKEPAQRDELSKVLEKEEIIKDIKSTQEGLKALLDRVEEVTSEIKKTSDENATLQVYLDNMAKNTALLAGGGKGR